MKKILLLIIIASTVILYSCKKETHCYNCKELYIEYKYVKGTDTIIIKGIPNLASNPELHFDTGYAEISWEIKWTTFYIEQCERSIAPYGDSCYLLK